MDKKITQGRSIRLYLVDGSPNGLLTAEIMNWTGHALTAPRSRLAELVKREECSRTGVYFLVGVDPDNNGRTLVYIGESDDVAQRLKQHNQPEEKGGKDFWERVCLITSKDQNLTKAHVKFLESHLIAIASSSGRCSLKNGTAHTYTTLPESDQADMAFFIDQIRIILPVLGLDFLHEPPSKIASSVSTKGAEEPTPSFELHVSKYNIKAKAQEIDGDFVVESGSLTRGSWSGIRGGYEPLFNQLVEDGILERADNQHMVFTRSHIFSSPSAAASVICGSSTNGRTKWTCTETGETYGSWQARLVEASD